MAGDFQPITEIESEFHPVGEVKPQGLSFVQAPPETTWHKVWDKVMDTFGPDKAKERARASNALVYSEMFGIHPSDAYKYHDQISEQVRDKLASEKVMVERKGYGEAFKAGLDNSLIGMMARQKVVEPFDSVDQIERWINGFTTMGADMPFFVGGYLLGGATPVTGTAGAFGLTEGLRRMLVDRYNKGKVNNYGELVDRMKNAALSTIKGEIVGAATGGVGKIPYGYRALNELATMTTVGKLLEGQVPSAKDFIDNAAVLTAMRLGIRETEMAKGALQEIYAKTGKHPAEVVDILKRAAPLTGEEQQQEPGLRSALKIGNQVIIGEEGETHPQTEQRLGIPIESIEPTINIEQLRRNPSLADYVIKRPKLHSEDVVKEAEEIKKGLEKQPQKLSRGETHPDIEKKLGIPEAIPEGYVRFYHGGIPGEGARDVTPDYTYAKGYADKTLGAVVQYIDVPKTSPYLEKAFDDTGITIKAPYISFTAPEEMMRKAKIAPTETTEFERGFTDPEGNFLDRKASENWVKENEPEVHETWKEIAGEGNEFHSEDYNLAKERVATGDLFSKMIEDETGQINLDPAVQLARKSLEKIRESNKASKYGHALRTFFTGSRDSRIAETNQLGDDLKTLIPDYRDQEALSLLRDFKNKQDQLKTKRNEYEEGDNPVLKKVIPIIDRALNPSPELLEADRRMTDYFQARLDEGKRLGFLDSSIPVDEYITHLLTLEEMTAGKKGIAQGKIGRHFQFGISRANPTLLDAFEKEGVKVKTFNALDAMTIYGDKHATVAATKLLIDELKTTNMGKWGFRDADNIPKDWVELSPGRELFRNRIAVLDKETGEPRTITQNLYVPEVVQKALAPIVDPASITNVPGFRVGRLYQAYIKSVELGLSVFHMKALNITALNNEKLSSLIKSYTSDLTSKAFKDEEIDFIKNGGTTSILGRTIEAYHAAKPATLPSRLDIIRGTVGIKQFDHLAEWLTHETFDVMQRKFKVMDYSLKKAAWIADHPNATPEEFTIAKRSMAKENNAAYGGLQWENLGVNKNTLELTKALLLAPDWTFSNLFNLKYAFEGGPAGEVARKFWIKSAITGIAFTEATSLILTGQGSKHPTEVYLGNDKNGKEVYVNMFFAGAPKDFVNFINNVKNYGAVEGIAHSIAQKMGPLARTGMDVLANRTWMGQPIVRREESFLTKTIKGGWFVTSQLAPIPFSISNIVEMMMNDKIDYSMEDFIVALGGSPPRHEAPYAEQKTRKKRYTIRGQ